MNNSEELWLKLSNEFDIPAQFSPPILNTCIYLNIIFNVDVSLSSFPHLQKWVLLHDELWHAYTLKQMISSNTRVVCYKKIRRKEAFLML